MALTKVTNDLLATPPDDTGLQDDMALIGFKVAANGSLAKYNLVDQTIDAFEDASGISAGNSTNEIRDSSGKYFSGSLLGSYSVDAFTSTGSDTWTCPANTTEAEVLVVAGGGAGTNGYYAGGGGAGGVVHAAAYPVTAAVVYDLSVGAGGPSQGTAGTDSVFNTNGEGSNTTVLTAAGGGRGGGGATTAGGAGGSGGGADNDSGTGGASTQIASFGSPEVAIGYGNAGGGIGGNAGAGGGGASAAGQGTQGNDGGDGGAGKLFSNFTAYGTDSVRGANGGYFGGGGGGACYDSSGSSNDGGAGGIGGGGRGQSHNLTQQEGLANTGGGGGAESATNSGKVGGSGVVLIRHRALSYDNMTLVSTTTTAQAAPTKGDIVFTYTNGAGSTTLGTDVTAEYSADGGSTWTSMTLGSEGSTGGHNIATAHDVALTSTSGTSMAYRIKTLNQSVSKTTRIQAVSLGWS